MDPHAVLPTPSLPDADQTAAPCPYCGHVSQDPAADACESCRGLFEPLSRQATQNAMGPWFIRDESSPFRPGCSYDTLRALASRGRISRSTILRGPSTRQFWTRAEDAPGVAHLLGTCHRCHERVRPSDRICQTCGVSFDAPDDRDRLGLAPVRPLTVPIPPSPTSPGPPAGPAPRATGLPEAPATQRPAATPPTTQPTPALPFGGAWRAGPAPAATPAPAIASPFSLDGTPFAAPPAGDPHPPTLAPKRGVGGVGLLVGLAAVALVVVVGAAALNRSGGQPTADAPSSAEAPTAPVAAAEAPQTDPSPNPAAAVDPAKAAEEAARAEWESRFRRALADADADTAEGIRSGLEGLRRIEAEAPATLHPPTLGAEIRRLERRLDELALRKFL